jgi:hypothetical protein
VELLPQYMVVGVFTPPAGVPGSMPVTPEKLNRIWSEAGPAHGYRQLQLTPDGTGAIFTGADPNTGVTIQPPLLQVRDKIALTASQSAETAQTIFKVAAQHLGIAQFFNLAVRLIYHAPMPDNDARGFVVHRILRYDDTELGDLEVGEPVAAGVKFIAQGPAVNYTVVIEPLLADRRYLYIDLNAENNGQTDLDSVTARAQDAERYLSQTVGSFLERVSSA